MLRFYAQSFVSSSSTIFQIVHILNRGEGLRDNQFGELGAALGEMMRECAKVDLPMTLVQLKRIKNDVDAKKISNASLKQQLHELMNRLWDELDTRVFYQIESRKVRYYEEAEKLSGAQIADAFPSAAIELADAARCYGLGRNTPCVFHLMRALEVGLCCLANVFNISTDHANWQNIIEQIEAVIRGLSKTKPKNWKQDQEFYSQAASSFMVLKDGWRNYTAHMRGRYDEEEALRIMDNVSGFMQKLSTRLKE